RVSARAAAIGLAAMRFDRSELAGAVADLGVLVPIAVALIVKNGLSPTAVLLPAGLLYAVAALVYRLPVPVQPLKAFGAIAIAKGLGADEIAAGALLMGAIFFVLGSTGLIVLAGGKASLGPSSLHFPSWDSGMFWTALTVLAIPQVPLSFANSCLATADAARVYFGERAARVRPGRLATTFGAANFLSAAIS